MDVTVIAYTGVNTVNMDRAVTATGDRYEVVKEGDEWPGDSALLSEFAGRACYKSWHRPNPRTASNSRYLAHIIESNHFSVLEHGSVSVYVTGVSRALTHELVRHRHLSFSQLSQRFTKVDDIDEPIMPPLYQGDSLEAIQAREIVAEAWSQAVDAYRRLVQIGEEAMAARGEFSGTQVRKMVREAARSVLPNCTPTEIVVTGNHRTWREVLEKRGSIHADAEIRQFAVKMYRLLSGLDPHLYQDFHIGGSGVGEVLVRTEVDDG